LCPEEVSCLKRCRSTEKLRVLVYKFVILTV
jgi:hypothetical protein